MARRRSNNIGTGMSTHRLTRAQRRARGRAHRLTARKLYAEENYWMRSTPVGPVLTDEEKAAKFLAKMRALKEQS